MTLWTYRGPKFDIMLIYCCPVSKGATGMQLINPTAFRNNHCTANNLINTTIKKQQSPVKPSMQVICKSITNTNNCSGHRTNLPHHGRKSFSIQPYYFFYYWVMFIFNRLTPNDPYMGRTVPLTSKRCILRIYSTNIGTEYFEHALYSPFFLFKMQFVS